MKTAIVIPARYASQRLPAKPLLRQTGKYLVQHVYERASAARRAAQVVVATDDSRIVAAVEGFGGRAVLTRRDHASGTDRVAEVAQGLDADVIVNLQGDEPLVDPAALDLLPDLLRRDPGADIATLAVPIATAKAQYYPPCSPFPLFWPICVAGAIVGTAATIVAAPFAAPRRRPIITAITDGPITRRRPITRRLIITGRVEPGRRKSEYEVSHSANRSSKRECGSAWAGCRRRSVVLWSKPCSRWVRR